MQRPDKLRIAATVIAVPLGFLLMELPYNISLLEINPFNAFAGILVLGLLMLIIYAALQRTRASLGIFVGLCLIAGIANHYVTLFKGQPIVPADLFALSTAAAVKSGYDYTPDASVIVSVALFIAYCVFLRKVPKVKLTIKRVACNVAAAIVLATGFSCLLNTVDFEEAFDCPVDVWSVKESYSKHGSALCFLKRVQDITPTKPEGYTPQAANDLLRKYASNSGDASSLSESTPKPHVLAIMNETFSDFSSYPGMEKCGLDLTNFKTVAKNSLASGTTYMSAMGGGTCNSEFEFLTGQSISSFGGGVYPYILYDMSRAENLAGYFGSYGYGTTAIHPAEKTNWSRNRVYEQLGFDRFDDIESFDNPKTLRDLVTDRETYDHALDIIEKADSPQFVFDVTIQNHGGYTSGLLDEKDMMHVKLPDGSTSSEVDEFATCVKKSDEDLAYLVKKLDSMDEPVVLCFFGDHQTGMADWLYKKTHEGASVDESSLAEVQTRYSTPYLIWANKKARTLYDLKPSKEKTETSPNYLARHLIEKIGLPQTAYQSFLGEMEKTIPVINMNGYLSSNGTWKRFGQEPTEQEKEMLNDANILSYDDMFDGSADRSPFWLKKD